MQTSDSYFCSLHQNQRLSFTIDETRSYNTQQRHTWLFFTISGHLFERINCCPKSPQCVLIVWTINPSSFNLKSASFPSVSCPLSGFFLIYRSQTVFTVVQQTCFDLISLCFYHLSLTYFLFSIHFHSV